MIRLLAVWVLLDQQHRDVSLEDFPLGPRLFQHKRERELGLPLGTVAELDIRTYPRFPFAFDPGNLY